MTREITTHKDGLGSLNDSIKILADEKDPKAGNSSHLYHFYKEDELISDVQFQHGASNVEGSISGITTAALLAALIDHLQGFQESEFRNRETAIVITHLEEAKLWLDARTRDRAKRNVLGTYNK